MAQKMPVAPTRLAEMMSHFANNSSPWDFDVTFDFNKQGIRVGPTRGVGSVRVYGRVGPSGTKS